MLVFLKYFCLYICSLYAAAKITTQTPNHKNIAIQALCLALLIVTLTHIFPNQYTFLPFVLYLGLVSLSQQHLRLALVSAVLAYGFSLALMTLIGFIVSGIFSVFRNSYFHSPFAIITIIICVLTPLAEYKILSIRRLKSGMPFLKSEVTLNVGTALSMIVLGIDIYVHYVPQNAFLISSICQLIGCLLLFPMILWWRRCLTQSYKNYLHDTTMQNLNLQMQQLKADNQRMTQIIYKDNKLIDAMTHSVLTLKSSATTCTPEELTCLARDLHQELLALSSHRQDSLSKLSGTITNDFNTGYAMLDAILNYQQKKASEHNTTLTFSMNSHFFDLISPYLDEEQVSHIIADLTQNALIATKTCTHKRIHITLSISHSIPSICVSDSGVPFPPTVLEHFGKEKCSQHLDDGGSGIGLMDIWKLKTLSKATLLIKEDTTPDSIYTKHIYLIFDKRERYIIDSMRGQELATQIQRGDVIFS